VGIAGVSVHLDQAFWSRSIEGFLVGVLSASWPRRLSQMSKNEPNLFDINMPQDQTTGRGGDSSRETIPPDVDYEMRYTFLWRNKWLTANATSFDQMISLLQGAVDDLRQMRARGVAFVEDGGASDDYVTFTTDDPAVAEEFGFEEHDCGDQEEEFEDDLEE